MYLCRSRYNGRTNQPADTASYPSYMFTVRSYHAISRDRAMLRLDRIYQRQHVSICFCKPRRGIAGDRCDVISLSQTYSTLLLSATSFAMCEKIFNQLAIVLIVLLFFGSSELNRWISSVHPRPRSTYAYDMSKDAKICLSSHSHSP